MEYFFRGIARAGGVEVPAKKRIFPQSQLQGSRNRTGVGRSSARIAARLLRRVGVQLLHTADVLMQSEKVLQAERCRS